MITVAKQNLKTFGTNGEMIDCNSRSVANIVISLFKNFIRVYCNFQSEVYKNIGTLSRFFLKTKKKKPFCFRSKKNKTAYIINLATKKG